MIGTISAVPMLFAISRRSPLPRKPSQQQNQPLGFDIHHADHHGGILPAHQLERGIGVREALLEKLLWEELTARSKPGTGILISIAGAAVGVSALGLVGGVFYLERISGRYRPVSESSP